MAKPSPQSSTLSRRPRASHTRLHSGASSGDLEEIVEFVRGSADLSKEDDDGLTPQHHAAREGRVEAIASSKAPGPRTPLAYPPVQIHTPHILVFPRMGGEGVCSTR